MSKNVFTSAPKVLVRSIAMAAVLGSVVVGGEASASITINATSATPFTSQINNFNSNDFLNGVWRREAGISVPFSTAARDAFKPGVQVRFADGQVRTISKVFVVGSNISVYFDGGLLDGNKVGAPRTVSTVVASGSAPVEQAPTQVESSFSATLNSFSNEDWDRGIYRKSAGFSVPATAANKAAFKTGVTVRLADGQSRKVVAIYDVGQHLSVMLEGSTLSAAAVGYPKTISVASASGSTPTPAPQPDTNPQPQPDPKPTEPVQNAYSATLNSFSNEDWDRGIYRKSAGFSVPATAANKAAFKTGVTVRLADGQSRKVVAIYDMGQHLSVMLEGSTLSAAAVGYPKTISVASASGSTPTPAPQPDTNPQPQPDPKPTEPVQNAYSANLNDFTNEDWERGIYRKSAGFSVPATSANKAAFKTGATVRLADGQTRKVVAVYDVGQHLSVMLDGAKLTASSVGYPAQITALSSTGGGSSAPSDPAPSNPAPSKPAPGNGIDLVGVNFASGVFDPGRVPGIYNQGYTYADESYFKRHSEHGFKLIRLGFLWERIQPKLGTPLEAAELARIKTSLDLAHKYGMKVILDMHNYYRYYGKVINSPEVPRAQFAETWRKIAVEVANHPALWGYGLMNEPYNTGNNLWPQTALEASKAIRKVDPQTWIMIAGDRYSSALFWESVNTQLISDPWMRDPKNNLVYEAHQYMDHDYSGSYRNRSETFAPMRGVDLVKPWVEWLKKNKLRGYLGEHGIPDFAPSGVVATDNLLAYLAENCIPSTYWAAGPRWGEDSMSLDVESGKHRPQLAPLVKHAKASKTCSTIGPLQ